MRKRILAALLAAACLLALAACDDPVQLAGLKLGAPALALVPGDSLPAGLLLEYTTEAPTEEQVAGAIARAGLVWESSDETVATADDGVITARAAGTADVGVRSADGLYAAGVQVTVVVPVEGAAAATALRLDLLAGETGGVGAAVQPANATGVEVTYQSSNAAVAAVAAVAADGTVTPVGAGEAEIVTTVRGDTAENGRAGRSEAVLRTRVTVLLLPQGIELESAEGTLAVGQSYQLQPRTLPDEAPETAYAYTSGDEAVATVDESGNVKAAAPGTCTLTVTSAEGHTAEYTLTVIAAPSPTASRHGAAPAAGVAAQGAAAGGGEAGQACWLCGVAWYDAHYGRCPVAIEMYNRGERTIDNGDGTFTPIAWLIYCELCNMYDGHTAETCALRFYCDTCGHRGHTADSCTWTPYVCDKCGANSSDTHASTCPYSPCPVCGVRNWGVPQRHSDRCTYSGYYTGPDSLV